MDKLFYLPDHPQAALSPHLPVVLLQISSALSHIFPDIRLDACKLVHLLIQHAPTHVIGDWPKGGNNILEGLRLALGLGEDKASSRLSAAGKLVVLQALLAYLSAALGDKKKHGATAIFGEWLEKDEELGQDTVKETTIGQIANASDIMETGYSVGIREQALSFPGEKEWDLGGLGIEYLGPQEQPIMKVLSVSRPHISYIGSDLNSSNFTCSYTHFYYPPSWKPHLPLFRPRLAHLFPTVRQPLVIFRSRSAVSLPRSTRFLQNLS